MSTAAKIRSREMEPARKPHVHVVGPEDSSSTDTILDETDRIIREAALRGQSSLSVDLSSDLPNARGQRPVGEQREPPVRCTAMLLDHIT